MTRREILAVHGYRWGSGVARALPPAAARRCARLLGSLLPHVLRARRATVARHLQRVAGRSLAPAELRVAVAQAFESYARYWVESFRLPDLSAAQIVADMSVDGIAHLDAAVAQGAGTILALPHLGGWDFGGAWLAAQGYAITVVVEPVEPPELFEWFAELRRAVGMEVVALGPGAAVAVRTALRGNGLVGLVCDRDIAGGGVDVSFFGERTTMPAGPVTLALRTGAPVLPTAVYYEDHGRHRAVVSPPLALTRSGSFRDDIARGTQQLADALEHLISAAPAQWHLFQPNWPSDPGYRR